MLLCGLQPFQRYVCLVQPLSKIVAVMSLIRLENHQTLITMMTEMLILHHHLHHQTQEGLKVRVAQEELTVLEVAPGVLVARAALQVALVAQEARGGLVALQVALVVQEARGGLIMVGAILVKMVGNAS
ncbi:MAG: hypothetical protein NVSMB27_20120 [Ktedonobacteraceae bacterium]